ncbi:methionine adenosyltransferase [Bifidobacterium tibiigranuli]|jgi:S-adenosylmethionine synthetase|uniref:methionine adenosyltransferase n=1 Tax=Bifidobacterium tibiigranuli TaxID=2172043 RepID=UPI0026E961EA|nr:methionine adenosyltransferase [Bifidobacterium tibiigranuli]MCI1650198.1 methionine adenosyltransferase [Bifidobacterium tibiigranuli]MCI1673897.1 methionine adenosyltransferase [Bifidobacterium tibiigranuli]MCI1712146.1 methionine adenosyltransferase [Bifidobacterium tibiigranuli]MCI1834258.1 methionine adenosyltransferase [Bifidobacterium tibiigranuli]MCI2185752.1 methionine adenosyltransferase [Bifidobacterium tibiigranuli]
MTRLLTSESVTEGHPDKVCDIISDSILDAYLALDPDSRVAVETSAKDGLVVVEGEVSAPKTLDHVEIVRKAIADIGYTDAASGLDAQGAGVINNIRPREFDSNDGGSYGNYGDNTSISREDAYNTFGGDQGLMVGYASDDTEALLPLPIYAASRLAERLAYVRKNGIIPLLRPDGKTLVSVEYANDNVTDPQAIRHILISTQHSPELSLDEVREQVRENVLNPVLETLPVDASDAQIVINRAPFNNGGPKADAGLTGRKIIVDTYGGIAGHGGGAFSGKDPRKPDRSAAYAARWAAKNIVAAGLARRAQVQLGYFNRVAKPITIDVETFGTETIDREKIQQAVARTFDFRQLAIIDELDLRRPIYRKTAAYGHFGRNDADFTWERTDKADELARNVK